MLERELENKADVPQPAPTQPPAPKKKKKKKTRQEKINIRTKNLKSYLLNHLQNVFEPDLWNELAFELKLDNNGKYYVKDEIAIYDEDIPSIRDLKAIINMLSAIERATEPATTKKETLLKWIYQPFNAWYLRRNYNVYASTNSSLTYYFNYAKKTLLKELLPGLFKRLQNLWQLCTSENFEIAAVFFNEQIISLEQYQQKYKDSIDPRKIEQKKEAEKSKDNKEAQKSPEPPPESFFKTLAKKNDAYLRRIYRTKYNYYFTEEKKADAQPPENDRILNYYPENKRDNGTVANLKKLSNGIIAISNFLEHYEDYDKSNVFTMAKPAAKLAWDLGYAYSYFRDFDYKAILADKTKPLADHIKRLIKPLNIFLMKLAAILEHYECESGLKEGTLLRYIDNILKHYNQITEELRIPVNYTAQEHTYHKARMRARKNFLADIDLQLGEIAQLLKYKDHLITNIPKDHLVALKNFIVKNDDTICMDRDHLKKYKKCLNAAIKATAQTAPPGRVERIKNFFGLTLHSEMMATLNRRMLYLKRQKYLLADRAYKSEEYFRKHFLKISVIKNYADKKVIQKVIMEVLDQRIKELTDETNSLFNTITEAAPEQKEKPVVAGVDKKLETAPEQKDKPAAADKEREIALVQKDKSTVAAPDKKLETEQRDKPVVVASDNKLEPATQQQDKPAAVIVTDKKLESLIPKEKTQPKKASDRLQNQLASQVIERDTLKSAAYILKKQFGMLDKKINDTQAEAPQETKIIVPSKPPERKLTETPKTPVQPSNTRTLPPLVPLAETSYQRINRKLLGKKSTILMDQIDDLLGIEKPKSKKRAAKMAEKKIEIDVKATELKPDDATKLSTLTVTAAAVKSPKNKTETIQKAAELTSEAVTKSAELKADSAIKPPEPKRDEVIQVATPATAARMT